MQGGGTGQFAAVPLNLLRNHETADYLISGVWTQKAFQEVFSICLFASALIILRHETQAEKYCKPHVVASSEANKFTELPALNNGKHSVDAAYLYYCANETINGVEYSVVPDVPQGRPLVKIRMHFYASDLTSGVRRCATCRVTFFRGRSMFQSTV
jgi:phosphoserine aminotransferase